MMLQPKLLLSSLLFLFTIGLGFGQKYQDFTAEEKALIGTDPSEVMRVFMKTNPADSLILNAMSLPIDPQDELTARLAERMLLTVQDPAHQGVGIAAPQVGINRHMIWVQRFDKEDQPFELFINPEIIWASELLQKGPEGDLSFDERGMVVRYYVIQVEYYNLYGDLITEILEGFTSVIFQHELDHLYGMLLTDRVESQQYLDYQKASEQTDLYFQLD